MNNDKPQLYLASPFFNDEQRSVVHMIEDLANRCDYKVYSPFRDGITLTPNAPGSDRIKVLEENMNAIRSSRLVVAATDGESIHSLFDKYELQYLRSLIIDNHLEGSENRKVGETIWKSLNRLINRDPGTVWELGFAHALNIPAITYSDRGFDINVMIGESVVAHTKSRDELEYALTRIRPLTIPMAPPDEDAAVIIADLKLRFKRDYRVF